GYTTGTFNDSKNRAVVFKVTPTGSQATVSNVITFNTDVVPTGGLTVSSTGTIFGETGPASNNSTFGSVFQITGSTHTLTTIAASLNSSAPTITPVFSFAGTNGAYPSSGLFADGSGNFFGYTAGVLTSTKDRAVIFKVAPTGSSFSVTTVYTFSPSTLPSGGLTINAAGDIFGETRAGTNANNFG